MSFSNKDQLYPPMAVYFDILSNYRFHQSMTELFFNRIELSEQG